MLSCVNTKQVIAEKQLRGLSVDKQRFRVGNNHLNLFIFKLIKHILNVLYILKCIINGGLHLS